LLGITSAIDLEMNAGEREALKQYFILLAVESMGLQLFTINESPDDFLDWARIFLQKV
jgi:hypothetical protein